MIIKQRSAYPPPWPRKGTLPTLQVPVCPSPIPASCYHFFAFYLPFYQLCTHPYTTGLGVVELRAICIVMNALFRWGLFSKCHVGEICACCISLYLVHFSLLDKFPFYGYPKTIFRYYGEDAIRRETWVYWWMGDGVDGVQRSSRTSLFLSRDQLVIISSVQ